MDIRLLLTVESDVMVGDNGRFSPVTLHCHMDDPQCRLNIILLKQQTWERLIMYRCIYVYVVIEYMYKVHIYIMYMYR